jgi:hypothetical protein
MILLLLLLCPWLRAVVQTEPLMTSVCDCSMVVDDEALLNGLSILESVDVDVHGGYERAGGCVPHLGVPQLPFSEASCDVACCYGPSQR